MRVIDFPPESQRVGNESVLAHASTGIRRRSVEPSSYVTSMSTGMTMRRRLLISTPTRPRRGLAVTLPIA